MVLRWFRALVDLPSRRRHLLRREHPRSLRLSPAHSEVGADECLAEGFRQNLVPFQCIQGFIEGGWERTDAPMATLLLAHRGWIHQDRLSGVQVPLYPVRSGSEGRRER